MSKHARKGGTIQLTRRTETREYSTYQKKNLRQLISMDEGRKRSKEREETRKSKKKKRTIYQAVSVSSPIPIGPPEIKQIK